MPKMRIHEVAKMFGASSNDIITALKQQGVEVKSHMSTISDENVESLKPIFSADKKTVKTQETSSDIVNRPPVSNNEHEDQKLEGQNNHRTPDEKPVSRESENSSPEGDRVRRNPDGTSVSRDGRRPEGDRIRRNPDGTPVNREGRRPEGDRVRHNPDGMPVSRDGRRPEGERIRRNPDGTPVREPRREGMPGRRPEGERVRRNPDGTPISREGRRPEGDRVRRNPDGTPVSREGRRPEGERIRRNPDGTPVREPRREGMPGRRPEGERVRRNPDGTPIREPRREGMPGRRPEGERVRRNPDGTPVSRDGRRPEGERVRRNPDGTPVREPRREGMPGRRPEGERIRRNPDGTPVSREGRRPEGERIRRNPDGTPVSREGRRPEGDRVRRRPEGSRDERRGDGDRVRRTPDGNRDPRRAEGRRFPDSGDRDGRRPDRPSEGRRDDRGPDGRRGDGRNTDGRRGDNRRGGGRSSMPGGDMPTKESRSGGTNRHEINREHSKDNNRGELKEGRGGRNNRRNENKNKNKDYGNGGGSQKGKKNQKTPKTPVTKPVKKPEPKEDVIRNITLPDPVSLKELADAIKVAPSVIIKKLFMGGKMVTINTEFSFDEAAELALEYNCIAEEEVQVDVIEELLKEEEEDESKMIGRPPVVCVMGHVDHGKTSLLDYIRSTQVTAGEAGGITQHIGAYVVDINGEKITFLDTPGHEAFTSMRLRGAQATDIAVLVVAADDGVMPQTIEAINHAKAAEVEVIVAVNKIDKEGANVERVKQELTEYGLIAEDWGGSTVFVPVSAKTGEGIEELLEMITLTAEVLELKANPKRMARGLVIEAKLDKGRGSVATVLIQKGTLHVGDTISIGHAYGRVRAMIDDKGNRVQSAEPSVPVEILGLNEVPFSGEVMMAHGSEKEARSTAEAFIAYGREKLLEDTKSKLSLDDLFDQIQAGNIKELNLVVKADVQGSVEAVRQSLMKLSNEEVMIKVIHGGVGAINESDVTLASASNAIIIGFNVRPDAQAKSAAEREKVDMRLYRVIYNAIEDIEAAMKGMLDPIFEEKIMGHLEVRQIYKASGIGTIAGCYVTDGMIQRNSQVRLVRDGIVIYEGTLASLKRFKDDVKEVKSGFECGCVFEKYNDVKEGDQVEAFIMQEIPR